MSGVLRSAEVSSRVLRRREMRIHRTLLVFALATIVIGIPIEAAEARSLGGALLPDLGMGRMRTFSVETTESGQTRLRFTTVIINLGDGPLEVYGHTPDTGGEMLVDQRIATDDRTWMTRRTPFRMFFAGDGHHHWHVRDLATYELRNTLASVERTGEKHGFCFFDNASHDLALPRAPASSHYAVTDCGTLFNSAVTTGLSVGWGDRYGAALPDQYIDISGLPAGEYVLTATVDAQGFLTERCEANNSTTAALNITEAAVTVTDPGEPSRPCGTSE